MDRNIPIEWSHQAISNGFGFLTIPVDKSRDSYLRDFYLTGTCMLITTFNAIKNQILVPKHLIDGCEFPQIAGDKGSLVHWTRIPGSGQLVITGIFLKDSTFNSSSEKRKSETIESDSGVVNITKDLNINGYQISVTGDREKPGQILLTVSDGKSKSKLLLHGGGLTVLQSSNLQIDTNELSIKLSDEKKIMFDKDELEILFGEQKIVITDKGIAVTSEKMISLQSGDTSVGITSEGIVIESDKKIYLGGDKPVLYAKSVSAGEILDISQIGVSKKVRVS